MTDLFVGSVNSNITSWIQQNVQFDYSKIPLCFEALEDGNIKLKKMSSTKEISLLYSFDNKAWQDYDNEIGIDIKLGEKLYLKAKTINEIFHAYNFNTKNKVNVYGNIMSLLYNDFKDKKELTEEQDFSFLFYNTKIYNAYNLQLPALKLSNFCYHAMFQLCNYLTYAPKMLPATVLKEEQYAYMSMFQYCNSLIYAPLLLATTIAEANYFCMFDECYFIKELHYPKSLKNDEAFALLIDSPWFGATNATVYYDL